MAAAASPGRPSRLVQKHCVMPAGIVRRSPYCGALALTPVPLRI
jgi:hypothetical protein